MKKSLSPVIAWKNRIVEGFPVLSRISFAAALLLPTLAANAVEVRWPVPPPGYSAASSSIPKGTLSPSRTYPTRNYGNRAFRIHTPPGFSATRAEKYPVLYLLHGIGGNEHAWTSNNGTAEGNADKVMDFLYARFNATPMLVVMPMGNMTGTNGDTWKNFEDVLMNDLAPFIQRNFNGSSLASKRALAGLSMGAGQTLNFGYKNPAFFNWIGAFSPAPNTIAAGSTIKDLAAVKANIRLNFFAAGTMETTYLNIARNYHNYLNANGVTSLFLQVEQGMGHERENWNRQLHNFGQRIFKAVPRQAISKASAASASSLELPGEEQAAPGFLFRLDGRTESQRPATLLYGPMVRP